MTVSNSSKGTNGTYVRVEDYAALKAERDALAAENLDLKHPGTYLPSKRDTPATDAYANQLRAEGVEMFAKHFNCADISDDILEFAANLRKENGNG